MAIDENLTFWRTEFSRIENIIVANGEIPNSDLSLAMLKSHKNIICCDGALQKLLSLKIIPDVAVGDGDSVTKNLISDGEIPFFFDKSEEYNDLQKALKYCIANGLTNVLLLGCGGLREDHFIANLSIMATYSQKLKLTMLTENGIFDVFRTKRTFASFKGMQVSVFCKNPTAHFTFSGLKYPANNRNFNFLWEGSLNEAVGSDFSVFCDDENSDVIVFRTKK